MPTLTLKLNNQILGDYPLPKGVSLTIGRRNKNNLIIQDLAVSGHHAKIDSVGDRFVLIDLQSKNGSFVNEQLISSHWLSHGDIISIGKHSLVFNYPERENSTVDDGENLDQTILLDTSIQRNSMRKSNPTKSINNVAGFWDKRQHRIPGEQNKTRVPMGPTNVKKEQAGSLVFLAGGQGEVNLANKYTTIGKHPTSDITIKGLFMGQTSVTISKLPDGFHLCYVGGMTKPKVNNKIITKSTILQNEDIITVGATKLQFLDENSSKN